MIGRTTLTVQAAREGKFVGSTIPSDLQRQWIQGPALPPSRTPPLKAAFATWRNALLSGADGWMFDGEDALGQLTTMSLDNQRNLKLAIARDRYSSKVAEQVAGEINGWAQGFSGKLDRLPTGGSSSTSRRVIFRVARTPPR